MAGLEINIEDLNLDEMDVSMDKVLHEYPISILPKKFHERTGKAKKNLFEEVDKKLYQKDMITFHTSVDRVHYWIKTFDFFYYHHLGNRTSLEIKWYDMPETWTNPEEKNSIVIELYNKGDLQNLLYNVTFYVTTGTIRVQGKKHMFFVQKHFPILKQILDKVVILCKFDQENPVVDAYQNVIDTSIQLSSVTQVDTGPQNEDDDEVNSELEDSLTTVKAAVAHEESVTLPQSDIVHLEKTVTEAFKKMETQQSRDNSKLMSDIEHVKSTCETIKSLIGNIKPKDQSDVVMLNKTISSLREKNLQLETQLRTEVGNATIEKSSLEINNASLQSLLDSNRQQLKQTMDQSQSEFEQYRDKLRAKDNEIAQLSETIHQMAVKLDKAQDEIIQLKQHISASVAGSSFTTVQHSAQGHQTVTPAKPSVLLVGTSNVKDINEAKITDACSVTKIVKYTMKDAKSFIESNEGYYDALVLHILTNDLKTLTPQQCVSDLEGIVSIARGKWPMANIIISLATPRKDNIMYHTNGQIINALIKQKLISDPVECVSYCEHTHMMWHGSPIDELLNEDKYHLSTKGVSILASNLKKAIHSVLDIPMPPKPRGRSRSRGPLGRGRGLPRK